MARFKHDSRHIKTLSFPEILSSRGFVPNIVQAIHRGVPVSLELQDFVRAQDMDS
ncbi:predicted protein [Botrytis cinerea T4]|uniref:Uncharacterized protein n=1 Tax=Botryotinia fuckeliana (strain T4) TaxID=999810 RepID=G2Y0V8_BOTF4|nr:predicted protein [Botrytis cinerea T4]